MKTLTEWIEQKISDKDINYFNYNEFKSLEEIGKKDLIKENWECCEIGVVKLIKILRNDSEIFESDNDNDEIFTTNVNKYFLLFTGNDFKSIEP